MIPYVRTVQYLSPSSFMQFRESPVDFYRRRLGPVEDAPAYEPQTFPQAVGNAFDAAVKAYISRVKELPCPEYEQLITETVTIEPASEWERAVKLGWQMAMRYVDCGAMDDLLKDVVAVEIDTGIKTVPSTDIPIKGHLDALLDGDVVFDWKTRGANSPGKLSPVPGYKHVYDTRHGKLVKGPHHRHGEPLENLFDSWATQTTMYTWLTRETLRTFKVALDQVVVGENGHIRVACYRTTVTSAFQRRLRQQLIDAWDAITNHRVIEDSIPYEALELLG